jgi:hypothetical protein
VGAAEDDDALVKMRWERHGVVEELVEEPHRAERTYAEDDSDALVT